uniref:ORF3 protein n=3 Tax=unclassified Orthocoronavirinae TaxID=2730119 RepID=A0AA49EDL5_9NIDO|nr:ORF3 protein [Bat Coronavirus SkHI19]WCC62509.1 ORF3 protein [Bat Coronavirus SkHI19]WCC62521.1 ORF3 protein [Bat Coronavirus SkGD17]WCC62545.1 ORF3 protein [Bat Coronavirus SkGD18]
MFLGLFQYTIDTVVENTVEQANLSEQEALLLEENIVPLRQASHVTGFLLTSVFVYFFALFKASSYKRNVLLFIARVCALICYAPILIVCGAYLDAVIVILTLTFRLLYLIYYAWRYKTFKFIIYNSSTLMFLHGHANYYNGRPYVMLEGGSHYVTFGTNIVPFVSRTNLYLAIRGRNEIDIQLLRTVELLDGNYLYIFSSCQVVGVTNSAFEEIQLDEYASISE